MNNPWRLNERAKRLADHLATMAGTLRIEVTNLDTGTTVLDCGIDAEGGLQAGLGLARVCLAGLGEVTLVAESGLGLGFPLVQINSDAPVVACMASQYAGWQIAVGKYFAMGSGPMRAAAGREELFDKIGFRETSDVAVGVLESRKLPTSEVAAHIAERSGVSPDRLTLLVAPAASLAGAIQVVARSVETALHKLFELGFDLQTVASAYGTAPLPPVATEEIQAIGRTNDAILYGGRVVLWVRCADERIMEVGPQVPSSASPDHGAPFADIYERYQRDFYKIDPKLFSPAEVVINSLSTGKIFRFGKTEPEILRQSFLP